MLKTVLDKIDEFLNGEFVNSLVIWFFVISVFSWLLIGPLLVVQALFGGVW